MPALAPDVAPLPRVLVVTVARALFVAVATTVLAPAVLGDAAPLGGSGPALALIVAVLVVEAAGTNAALWRWCGRTRAAMGWRVGALLADAGLGLAGFAACAGVMAGVYGALGGAAGLAELGDAITGVSTGQRATFVAIGVLGACVTEESLYRGSLQPALVARLGPRWGLVVTSALFSALHLTPNPAALVAKFLFGLIFGALARRTGRLVAPAVAHALVWFVMGAA